MSENQDNEDNDQPAQEASGSRWEPAEPEATGAAMPVPPAEAPAATGWIRGKGALIGAALALTLLAGTGGFALAHVVSDRDGHGYGEFHHGRDGDRADGDRGWRDGRGDRFGGPMPGGPGLAPGDRPEFGQELPEPADPEDDAEPSDSTQG